MCGPHREIQFPLNCLPFPVQTKQTYQRQGERAKSRYGQYNPNGLAVGKKHASNVQIRPFKRPAPLTFPGLVNSSR